MHVPWGWIKQRPHFLAEELCRYYDVRVMIPKSFKIPGLTVNNTRLRIQNIFKFPFERFKIVRFLNTLLIRFIIKYIYCIESYRYVWVTDMRLYPLIKDLLHDNQILIYDCMDDVMEFDVLKTRHAEILCLESMLFAAADLIFFSSEELMNRKRMKYGLSDELCHVVFNALDKNLVYDGIFDTYDHEFRAYKKNNQTIITYIGTVSNWLDFDLIDKSLQDFDNIIYFIVGPVEKNIKVLKHDRIKYFGSIDHKFVKSFILNSDILIMPFILNPLVTAVNPVKMYEYIAFGKKIISIKYDELDKFSNYVNFYTDYIEFKGTLNNMLIHPTVMISNEQFVNVNNWEVRAKDIVSHIENLS